MLDDRVRAVLDRLEAEDADERAAASRREQRSRQVARRPGQFLFAFVAPQTDCEVLEIGGSRGYSTIWLAAGVRNLGGRVLSLEHDPAKVDAWRANVAEAGLDEWAELVDGDADETLPAIDDVFDVVFLDAEKDDYERLFQAARDKARARRARDRRQRALARRRRSAPTRAPGRPTRPSSRVTVPLDRGLELSVVLSGNSGESSAANRGKEVVREWRFLSTGSGGTSG